MNFTITNFATTSNPEAQKSGVGSNITEYSDRVVCTIGTKPSGGSTFSRLKYRLETPYKRGDDFIIWMDLELPDNFYTQQNGSMRLVGLWNNTAFGRLGLWIDSDQRPRLQMEGKDKRLISPYLWRGNVRQYPTGRHKLSLHIILGELTELLIDDVLIVSVAENNMPYADYSPNQILWMFDGANANTRTITAICWEIGGREVVNICRELEFSYLAAEVGVIAAKQAADEALVKYNEANDALTVAAQKRDAAFEAWKAC